MDPHNCKWLAVGSPVISYCYINITIRSAQWPSPDKTVHFDSEFSSERGYGLPAGSRLVGTPRFGVATSTYGRDYRLGYSLKVFEGGGMSFDLGFDAQRRKSPAYGDTDHGTLAQLIASWWYTCESSGGNGARDRYG